jgi:hypothetical protein
MAKTTQRLWPIYFMYFNFGRVHQTSCDAGDGSWHRGSRVVD